MGQCYIKLSVMNETDEKIEAIKSKQKLNKHAENKYENWVWVKSWNWIIFGIALKIAMLRIKFSSGLIEQF